MTVRILEKCYRSRWKGGVLARLILLVLLLAVIGFVTYKSITGHERERKKIRNIEDLKKAKVNVYVSDEDFWEEYFLAGLKIRSRLTDVTRREEQPQITEEVTISGPIYEDDEESGTLSMTIDPNGRIRGSWKGKTPEEEDQEYQCRVKGYVYPEAVYKGRIRKDRSKLFLLGRVQKLFPMGDSARPKCSMFIRGWLNNDYTADGKILFYESSMERTKAKVPILGRDEVTFDYTLIDAFDWEASAE
ncbi:MAG: hypothetical protein ACYSR6_11165 [Planctomycetota bacterium]